ncbi:MAG: L,D-transpeptidase [Burkholderiaceae bacterium]
MVLSSRRSRVSRCAAWTAGVALIASAVSVQAAPIDRSAVGSTALLTAPARDLVRRVLASGDNRGLPFAIIDKRNARVTVMTADGQARGSSPVLLGLARGDDSVPGIGERKIADIRPEERTTPAGRFLAEHGVNTNGEDIFWIDYDAAVSMHRVRANNKAERRLERLASSTPADNRISYGCINVPAAFYDRVIVPTFASFNVVVYVLPDVKPIANVFGAMY